MKHDIYKLADQYHLSESDQLLLQAVLDAVEQQAQYSVREFAARNYVSPAAVIRLSKKLGYTGYTDMIYRPPRPTSPRLAPPGTARPRLALPRFFSLCPAFPHPASPCHA